MTECLSRIPEFAAVRVKHALFLVFGFILAVLLKNGFGHTIHSIPSLQDNCEGIFDCQAFNAMYRISFTLFVFYLFLGVLSSPVCGCISDEFRLRVQTDFWLVKCIAFIVLLVLPFLWNNHFYAVYAWIASVGSGVFILLQIIILVDFAYGWNDAWLEKAEKTWKLGLLCFLVLFYVVAISIMILMIVWYSTCGYGIALIVVTVVYSFFLSVLTLVVKHASLFPTSVVVVYCSWTCISALMSGMSNDPQCSRLPSSNTEWSVYVQGVIAALVLGWTTISSGNKGRVFSTGDAEESSTEETTASSFTFSHFVLMLASFYMAMLLSNWELTFISGSSSAGVDNGKTSMWIKIGSQWATLILYTWTILAPTLCKDRAFA
jgi:hypothetical protein